MISFSFPKEERLLNRQDFVKLNRLGKRRYSKHFVIIFSKNGLNVSRLGIIVSKKTGNSVKRNGVKRYIREFFRLHKTHFPQGYDIVIAARKGAGNLDFRKTKEELGEFFLAKKFDLPS